MHGNTTVTRNNNKGLWKSLIFFFKSNGLAFRISSLQSYFDFANITSSTCIQKKVTFFKCKGGDETALLRVNIRQANGDKVLVSLLNQKKCHFSRTQNWDIWDGCGWCLGTEVGIGQGTGRKIREDLFSWDMVWGKGKDSGNSSISAIIILANGEV